MLLQTHELSLLDGILEKEKGTDGIWTSNALFNVPDPERFSLKITAPMMDAQRVTRFLFGIVPKETPMAQEDIESHTGVFLQVDCRHDTVYLFVYMSGHEAEFELAQVRPSDFQTVAVIRMEFQNRELHIACGEHPPQRVPLTRPLPDVDYRPCISIPDKDVRLSVVVELPSRKRKAGTDDVQAGKMAKQLWTAREFTDAIVFCGKHEIPVHRAVLSAVSPFFARAFKSSLRESVEAKVTIQDADPEAVEILLSFLYTGVLDDLSDVLAATLLPIAHRLEVSELVWHSAAKLAMNLSERTVVSAVAALRPYRDDPNVQLHWEDIMTQIQNSRKLVSALMCNLTPEILETACV